MNLTRQLIDGAELRLIRPDDAESYCAAQLRSREHLAPWEPRRPEEWYDPGFQAKRIQQSVDQENITSWALVKEGRVIGTATVSNIVPGPWRSGDLGYWVDVAQVGRGLASAAVAAICDLADTELLMHRIAASTGTDNARSQRVLTKNGFEQYGFARDYLHTNGAWRAHNLYQRILNSRGPGEPPA